MTDYVLIVGAAGIDITGQALTALGTGNSIPGTIKSASGGVARNVAENLARLGEQVILITALGNDGSAVRIRNRLAEANIDQAHILSVEGGRTSSYIALFDEQKNLINSIYDMSVLAEITPQFIYRKRTLIQQAKMIMLDSNLPEKSIEMLIQQAADNNVPIVADPTSTSLADKLKPHLANLYMITPNANEAEVLAEQEIHTRQDAIQAAQKLVHKGVDIAVVTLAEMGVVYATDDTSGHIPALTSTVTNITGAADAMTGAIIFGILNELSIDECVRLGASAAALTLQSDDSVLRHLNLDLLYDV